MDVTLQTAVTFSDDDSTNTLKVTYSKKWREKWQGVNLDGEKSNDMDDFRVTSEMDFLNYPDDTNIYNELSECFKPNRPDICVKSNRSSHVTKKTPRLHDKRRKWIGLRSTIGLDLRLKTRKDPLPMKLRALPASFWEEPNNTTDLSPATMYPMLPPLNSCLRETITNEANNEEQTSDANVDLLFSLFDKVDNEIKQLEGKSNPNVIKRGRPRKPLVSSLSKKLLLDEDPCLISSAADAILPLIPVEKAVNSLQDRIEKGQQALALFSSNPLDKHPLMPSVTHKYSQLLAQLVVQL